LVYHLIFGIRNFFNNYKLYKMKKLKLLKITLFLITVFFFNCDKEFDYGNISNAVKTIESSNITQTSANVSGLVMLDNGSSISARGICYSTSNNPSVNGPKVISNPAVLGNYFCNLTNLAPETTYYAKAFATNSFGTAYGATITFTTLEASAPILSNTTAASSITTSTAISGGVITNNGASPITSRGVCYSSTVTIPTIAGPKTTNGTGIGTFTSSLTGLTSNTTYYIRAYATNGVGTAYGDVKTFTTSQATLPTGVTTTTTSVITQSSAISGGNVTSDGGAVITSKGVCWSSLTTNPTITDSKTINGSGIGSFSSTLSGLLPSTTYYIRAYATNSVGTAYGNNTIIFTTLPNLSVGQLYQGGVVAYLFAPGDTGYISGQIHGLIATASNQSTGAPWGCSGTSIVGTSTAFGTGLVNTTAIVNGCISSTSAAALCNNLISGGYTDWYLPSYNELNKLYLNRLIIGGFNNTSYWTSSQSSSTTAWSINFSSGTISSASNKTNSMYVRAIRKF
jgi:hypothetical protein